jgi:hypothetical protein
VLGQAVRAGCGLAMKHPRKRTHPLSAAPAPLTRLSHQLFKLPAKIGNSPLAWASLVLAVAMTLFGSGCMVTDSPDFTPPPSQPSKPFLTATSPPSWAVLRVHGVGSPTTYQLPPFVFEVVSEDLNTEGLYAALVLDYPGPDAEISLEGENHFPNYLFSSNAPFPPGHLDPTSIAGRPETAIPNGPLPSDTKPGCHSVTLLVTHHFVPGPHVKPITPGDLGILTWWLDVEDLQGGPSTTDVAGCLNATITGSADGG